MTHRIEQRYHAIMFPGITNKKHREVILIVVLEALCGEDEVSSDSMFKNGMEYRRSDIIN